MKGRALSYRPAFFFTWDEVRCKETGELPEAAVLESGEFRRFCMVLDA